MSTSVVRSLGAVAWLFAVPPALAQTPAGDRYEGPIPAVARSLVPSVMAVGPQGGIDQGAGIVLGASEDSLYIATAAHVVWRAGSYWELSVVFSARPGDTIPAAPVDRDPDLDIAVIAVPLESIDASRSLRAMNRMGDAGRLRVGDPVAAVGCPNNRCWMSGPGATVQTGSRDLILFAALFVAGGSSGGALFNEQWEVVGLVVRTEGRIAEAIGIERVAERAEEWGVPVRLRRSYLPRKAYRISIGVATVAPASTDAFPRGRFPGGRVTIVYQIGGLGAFHGGAVRFTPVDLSITGGMIGVGLTLKRGALLVHPFVEGGFARFEGRFDAGGYYTAGHDGTNQYVPYWNQIEADRVGFGLGLSLQLTAFPRTIVEVLGGHWNFGRPENARKMTTIFLGAGLRLGL